MTENFDVIVIGGGSGGLIAALGANSLGCKVALIENEKLGGDCLNFGCVPSKTLIKAAKVTHLANNAEIYGVQGTKLRTDFKKVLKYVKSVQEKIGVHDSKERFEKEGITVYFGTARFISKNELTIKNKILKAKKFVLATGSSARLPKIEGIEKVQVLTNREIFSLKQRPKHLIIIGAGPIGIEMAQAYARLGSKVTVLQRSERILPREDTEISTALKHVLETEGITILTNTNTEKIEQKQGRKVIHIEREGKKTLIKGDQILVATGRVPNVANLDLERAGVIYSEKGIRVNKKLRTTNKNIYACGDVIGGPQFTHVAEFQARIIVRNMLFPGSKKINYRVLPWVTFTDPELAHVGITPEEAELKKIRHKTFTMKVKDIDRAQTESQTEGLAKVVTTPSGKILGASILCANAGELLQEFVLAMQANVKIGTISQTIHPYPILGQLNRRLADQYYAEKLKKAGLLKSLAKLWVRF